MTTYHMPQYFNCFIVPSNSDAVSRSRNEYFLISSRNSVYYKRFIRGEDNVSVLASCSTFRRNSDDCFNYISLSKNL